MKVGPPRPYPRPWGAGCGCCRNGVLPFLPRGGQVWGRRAVVVPRVASSCCNAPFSVPQSPAWGWELARRCRAPHTRGNSHFCGC